MLIRNVADLYLEPGMSAREYSVVQPATTYVTASNGVAACLVQVRARVVERVRRRVVER